MTAHDRPDDVLTKAFANRAVMASPGPIR